MLNIKDIMPGLGFFGTTKSNAAKILINDSVEKFRLIIKSETSEFLNLSIIKLYDFGDREITLTQDKCTVAMSSVFKDDHATFGILRFFNGMNTHGELHTNREYQPWIELSFHNPVSIKQLHIFNRQDKWGIIRNKHLGVEVFKNGIWQEVWRNSSEAMLSEINKELANWIPSFVWEAIKSEKLSITESREIIKKYLVAAIDSRFITDFLASSPNLIGFLDIAGDKAADDFELKILAAYISGYLNVDGYIDNILFIASLVPDAERLIRLQNYINLYSKRAFNEDGYIFTRHGLRKSLLIARRDEYLDLLNDVINALSSYGKKVCLLYGSLLGAVRDKGFIAHDDDVDICYLGTSISYEDVQFEIDDVVQFLRSKGFQVITTKTMNRHVKRPNSSVIVDVFPAWIDSEEVFLHMEKMAIRSVPLDIMLPLSTIDLYGHQFPAPAKPEKFLTERYGEGWRVSDQFFEWPYSLSK